MNTSSVSSEPTSFDTSDIAKKSVPVTSQINIDINLSNSKASFAPNYVLYFIVFLLVIFSGIDFFVFLYNKDRADILFQQEKLIIEQEESIAQREKEVQAKEDKENNYEDQKYRVLLKKNYKLDSYRKDTSHILSVIQEDDNSKNETLDTNIDIVYSTEKTNNSFISIYTSMVSACENMKINSFYTFHILSEGKLNDDLSEKFTDIESLYPRCKSKFIDVSSKFKEFEVNLDSSVPKASYFVLAVPSMLKTLKKVIYLDSNTYVLEDLQHLFSLDLEDYYVKGHLGSYNEIQKFENDYSTTTERYISDGVLLLNLTSLRNDEIEDNIFKYIEKHKNQEISQNVQGIINYFCKDKIGKLPPMYGIMAYNDLNNAMESYYKKFPEDDHRKYKKNGFVSAFVSPGIVQLTSPKEHWTPKETRPHAFYFHYYLEKTEHYKDELEAYKPNFKETKNEDD